MIFLMLIGLIYLACSYSDNPTSIVKPYDGPDPGYIVAESNSGLSNRLRVMAAYMYIGEAKFQGAHLAFIWDVNIPCPGHFLSVLEPIDTVIFATNSSRYVLDKNAKIVYENSFAVFPWIMLMNEIPKNRFGFPSWNQIEYKMYSRYHPVREVMVKALLFIKEHGICNSSAMHLRLTDLDRKMGDRKRLNIHAYFKYVENTPADEKVFILTDNPSTQELFINKYGKQKILVYDRIQKTEHQPQLFIRSARDYQHNSSRPKQLAEDHRFTTLEHTMIDVVIAAHAKDFKPSPFSSLSELTRMLSVIGKNDRGWCGAGY